MGLTFDRFQKEVGFWARRNFPTSTDNESFHGIVEELGELSGALIQHQDALDRCDGDAEDASLVDICDAIGDTTVFLCDYAERREISISSVLARLGHSPGVISEFQTEATLGVDTLPDPVLGLVRAVGDLAHARLKARQKIRNGSNLLVVAEHGAVGRIAIWLAVLCSREGLCYETAVAKTWAEVSQRDWIANPATGRAPEAVTTPAEPEVYPADTSIPTRSTMPYEG